jgi:hypothetical protein
MRVDPEGGVDRRRFLISTGAAALALACRRGAQPVPDTATPIASLRSDRAVAAGTAPRRKAGVNLHRVDDPTIAWMQKLGITRARLSVQLNVWVDDRDLNRNNVRDNVDYKAGVFAEIGRCRSIGMEITLVAHTPRDTARIDDADGIAAYIAMLEEIVAKYPGLTLQIMNEWNAEPFFGHWFTSQPGQFNRGAAYGSFLARVYDAITAADPTCKVLAGTIASMGAKDQVDAYNGMVSTNGGKRHASSWAFYGLVSDMVANAAALRRAAGDREGLWLTEWGPGTPIANEDEQATFTAAALEAIDQNPSYFTQHHLYVWRGGAPNRAVCNDDNTLRRAAHLLANRTAE